MYLEIIPKFIERTNFDSSNDVEKTIVNQEFIPLELRIGKKSLKTDKFNKRNYRNMQLLFSINLRELYMYFNKDVNIKKRSEYRGY